MHLKASWTYRNLVFKQASGTSRGVLTEKRSYFIKIEDTVTGKFGYGECGVLKGLSIDYLPAYEQCLNKICSSINSVFPIDFSHFPSIRFGLEMAFKSLSSSNPLVLFENDFSEGNSEQNINGLVWMGSYDFMAAQIKEKLEAGFNCIKLKIGAINFDEELNLLKQIRQQFSAKTIELRVDANGAFSPAEALYKLEQLAKFDLHSIEQPIKQGQWETMAELCSKTPLPIALDEELIGVNNFIQKEELLQTIQPQYAIFKPSLLGGFKSTQEWIDICKDNNIGWWITSALESNIGLNAITQFTSTLNNNMPQGLGTGQLYTNNLDSPLYIKAGKIGYNPELDWHINDLF